MPEAEIKIFVECLARIVAEYLLGEAGRAGIAALQCQCGVALGIFPLAYLYGGAPAVPAVGRQVLFPERVGGRRMRNLAEMIAWLFGEESKQG